MIGLANRFNTWYDHELREPYRFLLSLVAMAVATVPLQIGLNIGSPAMALIGLVLLSVLCFVGALRALGLGGKHRIMGFVMAGMMGVITALVILTVWIQVFYG